MISLIPYPFENPEPGTRNPEPGTRNPEPGTRNPEPGTRNPDLLLPKHLILKPFCLWEQNIVFEVNMLVQIGFKAF